ncbi:hypothetical protein GCM10011391_03300 [Pullulanibacillus camelliae]|uniref:AB hydrolase-1 domain-containing protein n=1 Tax=Pullulanibacillus camelliae TaxID=1707096 RepID=A0A8J2VJW4_9BACL|nr:alpha/beta hydrolase [Pullulanibacillus camelliae]GGE28120.1 hypothetical protein GCM10011391_03300 [Pullulanibacillus camelliae]
MPILKRPSQHYELYYDVIEPPISEPETLIFVHGLGFSSGIWHALVEELRYHYRMIIYDVCGHDKSGVCLNVDELSWDFFVNELFDLMDHLEIDHANIVGHGFGGTVAMKAANADENRFTSLTLISTALYFPQDLFKYEYDLRLQLMEKKRHEFARLMALNSVNKLTPENQAILERSFRLVDEWLYKQSIHLAFQDSETFTTDLRNIKVPTLIMGGEIDPIFPVNYTAVYASYIKSSRLRIIPNASGAAFLDAPKTVGENIHSFLEERDRLYFSKSHNYLTEKMNAIFERGRKVEREVNTLHVEVLNKFSIQWRNVELVGKWNQRFAKELLLYLTLNKQVSREDIIEAFLPEWNTTKAKNYLRVMINHLRKLLSQHPDQSLVEALVTDRHSIKLAASVNSDLNHFLESLNHFEGLPYQRQFDTLMTLIRQYRYTFLPGFDAPWISQLKMRIEERLGHYMLEVVETYHHAGMNDEAILLLLEGEVVEPYNGYCKERINQIKATAHPTSMVSPPIG